MLKWHTPRRDCHGKGEYLECMPERRCCIEHAMADVIAYASYVNFPRSTRAAGTAAILQRAAHGGLPVLIPGALEVRVGRPTARPAIATTELVTPRALAADGDDRERLEHEREGGGAPIERTGMGHRTILARLSERLARASRRVDAEEARLRQGVVRPAGRVASVRASAVAFLIYILPNGRISRRTIRWSRRRRAHGNIML